MTGRIDELYEAAQKAMALPPMRVSEVQVTEMGAIIRVLTLVNSDGSMGGGIALAPSDPLYDLPMWIARSDPQTVMALVEVYRAANTMHALLTGPVIDEADPVWDAEGPDPRWAPFDAAFAEMETAIAKLERLG